MAYFTYEPKEEKDLIGLLNPGAGSFEVLKATEKMSKNNNPMIELMLKVWDEQGQSENIFDYLILNENKFSLRKIRHFCYAAGIENIYEQGKLDASDCESKSGNLIIGIQKDKTGQYPDKNNVVDYVYIKKNETSEAPLDDDIPFN